MEIIENQNLDPSRMPQFNEMESKSLTNVLNFIDNTSLCESETQSGITGCQGVGKCGLARALGGEGIKLSQPVTHRS